MTEQQASGTHTEHEDDPWTIEIGDHPGRTDSPLYLRSRKAMIAAVKLVQPWFYGDPPYQDHHGGGVWLRDAAGWFLVKNIAGVEWSSQFAGEAERFEALRRNAERLVAGFPLTEKAYVTELGMTEADVAILHTPITDEAGIAAWTDSFWNASVPLPAGKHTGVVGPGKQDGGVHYYPTPITDIQFIKRADFVLWVTNPATGQSVAVAPADFGSRKVRVLHDPTVLAAHAQAVGTAEGAELPVHTHGEDVVLDEDNPIAKAAFALIDQEDK